MNRVFTTAAVIGTLAMGSVVIAEEQGPAKTASEALLDRMRAARAAEDAKLGISGAYVPDGAPSKSISVPDTTQYVCRLHGKLTAIPMSHHASGATAVQIVRAPDSISAIRKFERIRDAYGGVFPYVVVHARDPFVIVNQENQPLVVGTRSPRRAIVEPLKEGPTISDDGVFVPNGAKDRLVYAQDRLDLAVQLPPGVPTDLLKKTERKGSTAEPTWQPNQVRAYRYAAAKAIINGVEAEVFRVNLE